MSTSKTYQQSLADAGSETRPPMLERGSYIPWASRFRRYINRKRENRKWLNKALDEGPYQFEMFIPNNSTVLKLQTAEDLQGDALLHYDAEMELMNLILLSIPNDIYNYVDACTSAKDMWKRVERLMRGTIQNKVDRETRFTNEFDQFVAEPGEALVSVYNRFAQLMNDLERNDMHFPIVTINTKFLNSLQPEWLKYVTQVRLAKRLIVDTFDDLFYYLHVTPPNLAHTGSSSRNTSSYYVTHPTSVVDYEDEYQQDDVHTNSEDPLTSAMLLLARAITQNFSTPTNNRLRTSSNTRNQAIIQGNTSTVQCYNCSGKGHYARNCPKPRVRDSKYFMEQMLLAKQDEAGVILTDEQNDFLFADASRMEEIEELSANICLMARIQPADNTSDAGPSYDSAFINTHVPDLCALEQLARNAYQEAEKQQIFAQKVQKQNTTLTSQLELYKERVRVLENINGDNNYLNEFLEADKRAKHFSQQAQSQFVRDRDIIRDLEKQRDKLDLDVKDYKQKNEELQKTHSILKRQMSENEDKYHDTVLDLEAKLKKNVDLILKLGNSLQGMFMLGPKPLSVYDQQLKHGLGYSEISLNDRDTEDTLDDASKSQQKMYEKMNDPIVVANKQNCWTIDYAQINALYKDFVPQKELSAEKKYFPSSFIPFDKNSNATTSIPASMPSESPLIIELDKIKNCFQRLSELIQKNCKRASIFYTSPEEIQLNDFCQDQLKPIVNELQFYFEFFKTLFQRDIKEMKDVFESTESELCELEKQNDFLKDQLLEVSLKHEVELSVLLNHECVDNSLHAEIEQLKKKSIEIQEGLQARIKILEKDVQRCEKQSVDFELKLQHEKEKHKWDSSFTTDVHLGDALSRKERVKSRRVRGMILATQSYSFKQENVIAERLHGLDQQMERKGDKSLYFMDRIWVLLTGQVSSFSSYTRRFQDVKLARIYIDEIIARNGILHPQADGQSEGMIHTLEDIMRVCVIDFGGSYHLIIWCAPFEALYRRKCRSLVLWAEIEESSLNGL
ncbi:integrase, catalytic region, zinc finger, CCHC-type containing protein, partial [Tanacetum coccineum]